MSSAPPVDDVGREGAVAFGKRRLADVHADKFLHLIGPGERGERAARVDLAGRRDWFDPCRVAHVRADVIRAAGHRIEAFVRGTGVQADAQAQLVPESLRFPVGRAHGVAEGERKLTGLANILEHEIQPVAPGISKDRRMRAPPAPSPGLPPRGATQGSPVWSWRARPPAVPSSMRKPYSYDIPPPAMRCSDAVTTSAAFSSSRSNRAFQSAPGTMSTLSLRN